MHDITNIHTTYICLQQIGRTHLCTSSTYYIRTVIYKRKNHEILASLQYKLLYNISRSEKWDKKMQAEAYNGVRMVLKL